MNRVAIVGAATGIGADCVRLLKARGAEVVAFDITEARGADLWIPLDLADPAAAAEIVAGVDGAFDALICNAGLPPRDDNAAQVLAVNVFGLIAVTRALEPALTEGAAITCTASRAGSHWRENLAELRALLALSGTDVLPRFVASRGIDATRAYNLSKEALIYWCKSRTADLMTRGIRINSVSPAPVATGILDDFVTAFGDKAEHALARVGRAGTPEEIASVIVFLSGPESRWVNGQDIIADGGVAGMMEFEALVS